MTKLSSQQIFVATNIILLGQKFCCNKHTFVVTNTCLSFQNTSFVVTKVCLSQQNYVCHNKYLLRQKVCHDKIFLSRLKFCRDKHIFVTTKMYFVATKFILVAAPTNDKLIVYFPLAEFCLDPCCSHWSMSQRPMPTATVSRLLNRCTIHPSTHANWLMLLSELHTRKSLSTILSATESGYYARDSCFMSIRSVWAIVLCQPW